MFIKAHPGFVKKIIEFYRWFVIESKKFIHEALLIKTA
jgi:hypothetical protein